jgi:hypothetical protein
MCTSVQGLAWIVFQLIFKLVVGDELSANFIASLTARIPLKWVS